MSNQRKWVQTIDIKQVIHRDQSNTEDAYVVGVANEVGDILKAKVKANMMTEELEESIEFLTTLNMEEVEEGLCDPLEELNGHLGIIYDWVDDKSVWLGL